MFLSAQPRSGLPRSVKQERLQVTWRQNPPQLCCRLGSFLVWLRSAAAFCMRAYAQSLLFFLAWCVERGPMWQALPDDPLVDAGVPVCNVKSRWLDPDVLSSVAAAASSGELGRTGNQVAKALHRLTKASRRRLDRRVANGTVVREMWDYWQALRDAFDTGRITHLSVSFDGTRVGGKEVLVAALWSAQNQLAAWAPPMVPAFPPASPTCVCKRLRSAKHCLVNVGECW